MILIVPWLAAIAVLVFEHLAEGEKQRSIRFCVQKTFEKWVIEEGVLGVWAEQTVHGYRICIDCQVVPQNIPGEIEGFPVRIRMVRPDQKTEMACHDFAKNVVEQNREICLQEQGGSLVPWIKAPDGSCSIQILGRTLGEELERKLLSILRSAQISCSRSILEPYPGTGNGDILVLRFW